MTEEEQIALNKVEGLKQYDVYASETVYYSKRVWAKDDEEAYTKANEEGFAVTDIYDGDHFEITSTEEVEDEA